jgi:GTP diphosphokinase / guanosine-3',5'-bis(diphosphate) 3'-diphosphatase
MQLFESLEERFQRDIGDKEHRDMLLQLLHRICDTLHEYSPQTEDDIIWRGFQFAYRAHFDQYRRSGEPYLIHPLQVTLILAQMRMDRTTLVAGLLHDSVEDNPEITIRKVELEFGTEVAQLVDGVTKISDLRLTSGESKQALNFRKMLLSMSTDLRVIFIKFADRLHNMRTISYVPQGKQRRIAEETLDVYAPLAHRFGMAQIKRELEDLCFKVLQPEEYSAVEQKVDLSHEERDEVIKEVIEPIKKKLEMDGVEARIKGRAKHYYSIHNKMWQQQKQFDEIFDLFAIRIIVSNKDECYYVLGTIHSIYTPVPDQFFDYIATPKSNKYQSLHTKAVAPGGHLFEVQIRTKEMDRVAEHGIAAHWKYKEGHPDNELDSFFHWFKEMLEEQNATPTDASFMESLKSNLFHDDIFVFTPGGKLMQLPTKSTPVDFAFLIHSEVGIHCIGAKADGRIIPLDGELKSGQTVEIITSQSHQPSLDWLKFVRTSRARSHIRRWFKDEHHHSSVELGREMLQRELTRRKLKLEVEEIQDLARQAGFRKEDLFYSALGSGELRLKEFLRRLKTPEDTTSLIGRLKSRLGRGDRQQFSAVRVQGLDNIMVNFARCCQPLPGDAINGFITTGKGITIHRSNCHNAQQMIHANPDKLIEVMWDVSNRDYFLSRIIVVGEDRRNMLHELTNVLTRMDINIRQFNMRKQDNLAIGKFVLEVLNREHLERVIKQLKGIKGVVRVERRDETIA